MGSLGSDDESSGSFEFAWVHSGALSWRRDHSRLRELTPSRLGVIGFFRLRRVSFGRA